MTLSLLIDSGTATKETAMRRALMTGFGNARLAHREDVQVDDLPRSAAGRSRIGFVQ